MSTEKHPFDNFTNQDLVNEIDKHYEMMGNVLSLLKRRLNTSTEIRTRYMVTMSVSTEADGNANYLKTFRKHKDAKSYFDDINFSKSEWLAPHATNEICSVELLEQKFDLEGKDESETSTLKVLEKKHFHKDFGRIEIKNGYMFKDGEPVTMSDGKMFYMKEIERTDY